MSMPSHKILLLGSGFVAQPCADYLLSHVENSLTIASSTKANAERLASQLRRNVEVAEVDVKDEAALDALVSKHDLVISLIPYIFHADVIKSAIRNKKNVVTTSYVSDAMKAFEPEVIKAGIIVMNEIGVDPGIDHLYAFRAIDEVHKAGGKIREFYSYGGGLPAPESADNPLGYKFSWSCRGSLLAHLNEAKVLQAGEVLAIDGRDVMKHVIPYGIGPTLDLVAFPNRDATSLVEKYRIPEASTIKRGNLRYRGFPEVIRYLVELGFMDDAYRDYLRPSSDIAWAEMTRRVVEAEMVDKSSVLTAIDSRVQFKDDEEKTHVLACFDWIGLFSNAGAEAKGTILDTLCCLLETKMRYQTGEKDMVVLQNAMVVEDAAGHESIRTQTLVEEGAPFGTGQGSSAMARLVGIPCGVAVQLILEGKIATPGIIAPWTSRELVDLLLAGTEAEGIFMDEM